jgi:hypothetical protein
MRTNICATNVNYTVSILSRRNNTNPLADCSPTVAQNGHKHDGSDTNEIYTTVIGYEIQPQEKYSTFLQMVVLEEKSTQRNGYEQNKVKQNIKEEFEYKPFAYIF